MKLYLTDKARLSAIEEIRKQIEILGHTKSGELDYLTYRGIVKNLNILRDSVIAELELN